MGTVYRHSARALIIASGAVSAWHSRYFVNPDGVAYLDVADDLVNHGSVAAIHPHRSPAYPALLAGANRILGVDPYYESSVAHAVTFVLYCIAFVAFEYLLQQIRRTTRNDSMPDALWIPLAYGLFVWSCNLADQTGPDVLTPDLAVAGATFVASGLLVRIARSERYMTIYLALGVSLGLGYLAKEAMLPVGMCMLIVAGFSGGAKSLGRLAIAAVLFAVIASMYFVPLSSKVGHFSTGETARYNYILWVSSRGKPVNARPVIFHSPLIVGYPDAAGRGTYAVADDLRFWLAGMRPRFEARAQLRAIRRSVEGYSDILRSPLHFALLIVFLAALLSSGDRVATLRRFWVITAPSLAALLMYGLVLVQPRYVAPMITVAWIGLFAGLPVQSLRATTLAMAAAWISITIVFVTSRDTPAILQQLVERPKHDNWFVAQHLRQRGIRPGDRVAVVGEPYMCYWARLAKVRLAGEVMVPSEYWNASPAILENAHASLERFGIKAIVAQRAPRTARGCWEPVRETSYSICRLPGI